MDVMALSSKTVTQHKKDEAKLNMEQLTEKRRKEVVDKATIDHATTQEIGG